MLSTVLAALALLLVLEGLMPLFSPKRWRKTFEQVLQMNDGQLRFIGLVAVVGGSVLGLIALWTR